MKRAWQVAAIALLVVVCVPTREARAACVGAVVVDGTVLMGRGGFDRTLPRAAGRIRAVDPACNDAGQRRSDGTTTVVRFEGVPADVAVRSIDGDSVYIAEGSLTALATHPLHQPARRVAPRRCTRKSTLTGTAGDAGFDLIELIAGGRSHFYRVDARTVLANRPAYQPIRRGQRLSIAATRCGPRMIADRIAFTGPTIVPEHYRAQTFSTPGPGVPLAVMLLSGTLLLALAVWLIERVTRPKKRH